MDWNQLKLTCELKTDEDLKRVLDTCGISHKGHYEEWEKELLKKYLKIIAPAPDKKEKFEELVKAGKERPEAIAEVLEPPQPEGENESEANVDEEVEETAASNGKKIRKRRKPISLFDLMKEGQKLTGKPITLARGQEFLAACGLPEKGEYRGEEAMKFLCACERVVNQGHSLAEVARDNGVDVSSRQSAFSLVTQQGSEQVAIFKGVIRKNAQLNAQVEELYEEAYFANLEELFRSGEYDRLYAEEAARIRQERGPTPFEQFDQQYQLWEVRRDPLARLREGTPDNPRLIEEDKGMS